MDKLKFGETIVLEDNREYTCFANIEDNGKDYVFLISNFKPVEVKIAEQILIGNDLNFKFITNSELKKYLFNLFQERHKDKFVNIGD